MLSTTRLVMQGTVLKISDVSNRVLHADWICEMIHVAHPRMHHRCPFDMHDGCLRGNGGDDFAVPLRCGVQQIAIAVRSLEGDPGVERA